MGGTTQNPNGATHQQVADNLRLDIQRLRDWHLAYGSTHDRNGTVSAAVGLLESLHRKITGSMPLFDVRTMPAIGSADPFASAGRHLDELNVVLCTNKPHPLLPDDDEATGPDPVDARPGLVSCWPGNPAALATALVGMIAAAFTTAPPPPAASAPLVILGQGDTARGIGADTLGRLIDVHA